MTKARKTAMPGMMGSGIMPTPRIAKRRARLQGKTEPPKHRASKHALPKTMHKVKEQRRTEARRTRAKAAFDKPEPGA